MDCAAQALACGELSIPVSLSIPACLMYHREPHTVLTEGNMLLLLLLVLIFLLLLLVLLMLLLLLLLLMLMLMSLFMLLLLLI